MLGGANGLEGHQTWAGTRERAAELGRESVQERGEAPHAQLRAGAFTPAPWHWVPPGTVHTGSAPNLTWRNAGETGEEKTQKT